MTQFLAQALAGLEPGGVNTETERLFAYHQATKHTYQSVRMNARLLDWRNQPNPFRTYDGAPLIALPQDPDFPEIGAFAAIAGLAGENKTSELIPRGEIRLDAAWLGSLLWHSMAVSAWKKVSATGARYSLRVNPSSGNLHPTETALALRGFSGLDDGLYHYRADRHALEFRGHGGFSERIAEDLGLPWAARSGLIVGLSSIFWRESWKYGDRAYRYCCHDLGHAMMSLLLSAKALGLSGGCVGHFSDATLSRALGLAQSDEAPMAFLAFTTQNKQLQFPAPGDLEFSGAPNELSPQEVRYDLLLGMHLSTILPAPTGPAPLVCERQRSDLPRPAPIRDAPLGSVARRRRSALDFDPCTSPMDRGDLEQLVDFATRDWHSDWRGNFAGTFGESPEDGGEGRPGSDFVELFLYVHRVRNCEPGVYRWDNSLRALTETHRGSVERVAAFLSLEQPLAGNACFAVSMIADLERAARTFGNRGYRYIYFEAGAIGQRLYIGAEALGWSATGIGAFYDDDVHRYLGLLEEGEKISVESLPRQVIYHFAVGRAIPDPRLED